MQLKLVWSQINILINNWFTFRGSFLDIHEGFMVTIYIETNKFNFQFSKNQIMWNGARKMLMKLTSGVIINAGKV